MLAVAIAAGLAAAVAALYGRYRTLPPYMTGPNICRLEAGGCAVLFRTPNAALLGVPNALLGITLYILLAAGLLAGWPNWLLLVVSTPSLLMSVYLARILVRDRLECRICWGGHAANAVIWLVLLLRSP